MDVINSASAVFFTNKTFTPSIELKKLFRISFKTEKSRDIHILLKIYKIPAPKENNLEEMIQHMRKKNLSNHF